MDEASTYQVRIKGGVQDQNSKYMGAAYLYSFTTFTPADISTIALWMRANHGVFSDAGTTSSTNGGNAGYWYNSLDSTSVAFQTNTSKIPLFYTNVINGKPVVRFDGADDFLRHTTFTDDPNAQALTFIVVFRTTVATAVGTVIGQENGTGGSGRRFFSRNNTDFHVTITTPAGTVRSSTNTFAFNTWGIHSATWDPGGPLFTFYRTGLADGTHAFAKEAAFGPWRIGCNKVGGQCLTGDVAEFLMFRSSLSTTDRERVECYLAKKYALTLDVSVTCP